MFSRTLLQLFTLSIIFTEQIEARCINKTHHSENLECIPNNTSAYKRSAKADEEDQHDTLLIKKTDPNQQSNTNFETKYDILARCKYNFKSKQIENEETVSNKAQDECDEHIKTKTTTPAKNTPTSFQNREDFSNEEKYSGYAHHFNLITRIRNTDIEKIKDDSDTKLKSNDESSLRNNGQQNHQTVEKHMLTVSHHNTKKSTTQPMTDKPLIPKGKLRWTTEVDDERCKTKHCDYTNHRSVEKISQENDIYRLKRQDEITTASKDGNDLKHRYKKRNKSFRKELQIDKESLRHSDNSHSISKENKIYRLENRVDFPSVEMPVAKTVKPKYKLKYSHKFQKKKLPKKVARKVSDETKHKLKTKRNYNKVITKKEKLIHNGNKEKHPDVRKGEHNVNSEDTLSLDKADAQTSSVNNYDEKDTLVSSEEPLKQNELPKKPRLPFYVTSATLSKKEIAKKYPKKQIPQTSAEIMADDLNKLLIGNTDDLRNKNIDINKVIDRLASSKILDIVTDRVAEYILKKLQNNQAFRSRFKTTDEKPEKVEKIDILFKNNGDMVMTKAENVKK